MRPFHVILILVFLGLTAFAAWCWLNRAVTPAEVEIAMEPNQNVEPPKLEPMIDDTPLVPDPPPRPVVPVPAEPAKAPITFTDGDCRWLTRHIPDADVAYKPGVDVHGKAVVPADLNGTYQMEMPEIVVATVSRRLLGHPNLRQETPFAEIEINTRTGAIKINGKGLDNEDQEDLIAWCKDRR